MDMGFSDSRSFDPSDGAVGLRPLGWSELCARLVAAQDLRRQADRAGRAVTGGLAPAAVGSFHRGAAHMLEHHGPVQDFVNSTSSGSGKGNQGKTVASKHSPLIERATRQADENCDD
jgi:hypothetical protein